MPIEETIDKLVQHFPEVGSYNLLSSLFSSVDDPFDLPQVIPELTTPNIEALHCENLLGQLLELLRRSLVYRNQILDLRKQGADLIHEVLTRYEMVHSESEVMEKSALLEKELWKVDKKANLVGYGNTIRSLQVISNELKSNAQNRVGYLANAGLSTGAGIEFERRAACAKEVAGGPLGDEKKDRGEEAEKYRLRSEQEGAKRIALSAEEKQAQVKAIEAKSDAVILAKDAIASEAKTRRTNQQNALSLLLEDKLNQSNVHSIVQRSHITRDLLERDVEEALELIPLIRQGVKAVYPGLVSIPAIVPSPNHSCNISLWLNWARNLNRRIHRAVRHESEFYLDLSIKNIVADNDLWETFADQLTWKFQLPRTLLEGVTNPRIRRLNVSVVEKGAFLKKTKKKWLAKLKLARDEGQHFGMRLLHSIQESSPDVLIGSVGERNRVGFHSEFVKGKVWNTTPFGDWEVTIAPTVESFKRKIEVEDVILTLHIAVHSDS